MDVILPSEQPAIIKIIGVGGGGVNAVNRMIAANVSNVEFFAVNTDLESLRQSSAENKIQLGEDGQGVGGDPVKAQQYAEAEEEKLRDILNGADMVFITTGMGGGTGTGTAPILAKLAKEMNILTVGVVTKPFEMEGPVRIQNANKGISKLRENTDALIIIPNDKIFSLADTKTRYRESFRIIDDVLRIAIESITDTITKTGEINIDFADVREVLTNSDNAMIALGDGQTLKEAYDEALANKFVEGGNITEANAILFNIFCSKNNEILVSDMREIKDDLMAKCKNKPSIKPGYVIDDNLDTRIKVAIIASFQKKEEPANDLFENAQKEEKKEINKSQQEIDFQEKKRDPFAQPACEILKPRRL
ncbi:MAG: cell division protein FtsZ [Elusimicrobia bacterium]|nr:cell division protein FtsZ [Elusimicrobiota bacterium]